MLLSMLLLDIFGNTLKVGLDFANRSILLLQVKEKKYETVETTSKMLQSTMQILSQTSTINLRMASNNTIRDGTTEQPVSAATTQQQLQDAPDCGAAVVPGINDTKSAVVTTASSGVATRKETTTAIGIGNQDNDNNCLPAKV